MLQEAPQEAPDEGVEPSLSEPRVLLLTSQGAWLVKKAFLRGANRRRFFQPAYLLASKRLAIDYYAHLSDSQAPRELKGSIAPNNLQNLGSVDSVIHLVRAKPCHARLPR
jgi:hypothetical protein